MVVAIGVRSRLGVNMTANRSEDYFLIPTRDGRPTSQESSLIVDVHRRPRFAVTTFLWMRRFTGELKWRSNHSRSCSRMHKATRRASTELVKEMTDASYQSWNVGLIKLPSRVGDTYHV